MGTQSPNTSLLDASKLPESAKTPAPIAPSSSAISFAFSAVQPPSLLYVDVDDQLILSAATSQTAEVITVNVRLLLPNGRLEDMQFFIRPTNTRVAQRLPFSLAQGYILSISAVAAVATTRGQTFLRLSTQRSASGTGNPAQMLFSDYVTTQATSAYPNGRIISPTEGPGALILIQPANPGAGNQWSLSVPTNTRWRLQSFQTVFIANASVANRFLGWAALVGGVNVFSGFTNVVVTASQTVSLIGTHQTPYVSIFATDLYAPIPIDFRIAFNAGAVSVIQSAVQGIQAGDTWGTMGVLMEEWLDNV